MLSRSLGMPSRKNGPPSIWDTHGTSGNVFENPVQFYSTFSWWIWTTMSRTFLKFSLKNMRWNWIRSILKADQRPMQNHKEENLPVLLQELFLLGKELGPMMSQENYLFTLRLWCVEEIDPSFASWKTSTSRWWWSNWILEIKRLSSETFPVSSSLVWRQVGEKSMAGGGGNKKRYQYCTDFSGMTLFFRALQGHSGGSLIDPTLQDNVVIPSNFFQHIYHVGCAINLHSIINSG